MTELIQFINEQFILVGSFVLLLGLLIFNIINDKLKKYEDINTNKAVDLMGEKNTTIIDVRELKELKQGIINKAINIPLAQIKDEVTNLIKENNILVYCKSGSRSSYACKQLTKNGFNNVYNLKGGVSSWQKANMPLKIPK